MNWIFGPHETQYSLSSLLDLWRGQFVQQPAVHTFLKCPSWCWFYSNVSSSDRKFWPAFDLNQSGRRMKSSLVPVADIWVWHWEATRPTESKQKLGPKVLISSQNLLNQNPSTTTALNTTPDPVPGVPAYLDVVVLAQVGRFQVKVAEGQTDPEPVRNADGPIQLCVCGIRVREVWRLQAAVHPRQNPCPASEPDQQREDEYPERKRSEPDRERTGSVFISKRTICGLHHHKQPCCSPGAHMVLDPALFGSVSLLINKSVPWSVSVIPSSLRVRTRTFSLRTTEKVRILGTQIQLRYNFCSDLIN